MSAFAGFRRVVTGLNAEGRSCVIVDGPLIALGATTGLAWQTEALPADNSGKADAAKRPFSLDKLQSGSNFMLAEHPPGRDPHWHAIDAVAYVVVLRGEMVLALERGELRLRPGDFVANRGVMHDWRAAGPEPALIAVVTIPALPVGEGRTI
jgi:quercetin dioxygenase-like cupin family protein